MHGGEYGILGMAGVGFFGMLVIGFLAGWIAEKAMNRDHGLLTNILVGIAGSFVGGTLAGVLGLQWYGFLGNLVIATAGAILILWFFGKSEQPRGVQESRRDGPYGGGMASQNEDTPIYHSADDKKQD
ncbi:MAG: GlsB/YeaQ/YmgE family stress response membrane protein [Nitratireductor sp.]|nr:GlsB/YeaQ/YmgE family stress response membrane protein [Nitratireductor sp.]